MLSDKVYGIIGLGLFGIIIALMVTIHIIDGKHAKALQDATEARRKETEALLEVANLTIKLNNKTVEVVEKVNTVYVETKVKEKPQIEYVTKNVEKLVMLPSYSNVCFDDAGLHLANSLITRTYDFNPTPVSQSSGGL